MKKYGTVLIIALLGLLSCGLEDFYFLDYIPQGRMDDVTRAEIVLPGSNREGYENTPTGLFTHFILFYRIYLSDQLFTGLIEIPDDRTAVNPALNTDFNSLFPLTDITSTTVNTANLENTFFNRNYYQLTLSQISPSGDYIESEISSILGNGERGSNDSRGRTLEIFFSGIPGSIPTLSLLDSNRELIGQPYRLNRAVDGPGIIFNPVPRDNRYFFSHPELRDTANANREINADVATSSRPNLLYSYVSMYIAATGRTTAIPPSVIYSQPTFIGVFRLPDAN